MGGKPSKEKEVKADGVQNQIDFTRIFTPKGEKVEVKEEKSQAQDALKGAVIVVAVGLLVYKTILPRLRSEKKKPKGSSKTDPPAPSAPSVPKN